MVYLLGAVALSVLLAWLVVWWHHRPVSMAKAIDDFWEARQAIAPRPRAPAPPGPRSSDEHDEQDPEGR